MKTLNVEQLQVESFETAPSSGSDQLDSTLYADSCGCGTNYDCPSDQPNCTTPCVVESGKTDWYACCG